MFTLTDSQFTRYARSQASMVISAHLEALRTGASLGGGSQQLDARIDGIVWTCQLLGIDLDGGDEATEDDE